MRNPLQQNHTTVQLWRTEVLTKKVYTQRVMDLLN